MSTKKPRAPTGNPSPRLIKLVCHGLVAVVALFHDLLTGIMYFVIFVVEAVDFAGDGTPGTPPPADPDMSNAPGPASPDHGLPSGLQRLESDLEESLGVDSEECASAGSAAMDSRMSEMRGEQNI
jgi:hypothetical protein